MELSLLWNSFAQRVGRRTARTPLLLYYVLRSDTTSKRDKAIIYACIIPYFLTTFRLMQAR
jgi:hypothetical protein